MFFRVESVDDSSSPNEIKWLHLVKVFGVSPLLVEQIPLIRTPLFVRFDVKLALKENENTEWKSFKVGAIHPAGFIIQNTNICAGTQV